MTLLTLSETYDDSPHFQFQAEKAQNQAFETWNNIKNWVDDFRSIIKSVEEFQKSTNFVTSSFQKLSSGSFKENGDKEQMEKMNKNVNSLFSNQLSQLKKMEAELIEPVINIVHQITNELNSKKEIFEAEQKSYDQHNLNYIGLIKCTMDPELACRLVEESHRLYSLRVLKCQKYIDWIGLLNHIQSNSESWWLQESSKILERLARWQNECSHSMKVGGLNSEEKAHNKGKDLGVLKFECESSQTAENIFRTDFAKYRKSLGLPILDLADASMLKCALNLVPNNHEKSGYLLFHIPSKKQESPETWSRGFFQVLANGRFSHVPSSICREEIPPIELSSASINEINHSHRHNVLQLSLIGVDSVRTIYLQAECTSEKNVWLSVFQTYINDAYSENGEINFVSQEDSYENYAASMNRSLNRDTYELPQSAEPSLHHFDNDQRSTTGSHILQLYSKPNTLASNNSNSNFDPNLRKMLDSELVGSRTSNGEEMIIKVGQVLIRDFKSSKSREFFNNHQPSNSGTWKKVMFTLKSTGILCQYQEQEKSLLNTIDLKGISRFNIRPLDDSYFNNYSSFVIDQGGKDVHYFSVATRVERNIWLCLLKGFAQPEILGRTVPIPKVYRVFRSFWIRIIDGRNFLNPADLYCQIAFDGTLVAFTSTKTKTTSPFWREDFLFDDLAPFYEGVGINVFSQNKYQKDSNIGRAFIPVRSMRPGEFYEGWYPVIQGESKSGGLFQGLESKKKRSTQSLTSPNPGDSSPSSLTFALSNGQNHPGMGAVADLRLKLRYDEIVVLKSSEYSNLLDLILDIESDLVYDLAIGPKYLDWVAETLLKIYCAKHQSIPWLNYLAENEVQRTEDPNILFRGNTILTKAIDAYMKMVGLQYVDETIGDIVREVCNRRIVCEVDESKLTRPEDVKGQWKTLLSYANQLFAAIQSSKNQCPRELRCFFNHLRKIISEKFENSPEQLVMTKYTCVSGFLFLRLFCPAVLSPKLFGLVKEHPDPKTHRTLTLLAKSLQCLANLADFGVKEPYMAQMNNFISENTHNLMEFIDYIASPPSAEILCVQTRYPLPPHPTGFHAQLPPYVIDLDRELSFLSGYVSRYTKALKQVAANKETRSSKPGKLEKLISVCNAIDFMVRDCVQSGTKDVTAELLF